ncbi:unnamed protein product, partial [Eruca vesicaria subsp. sativa]|nr:unnamed protein product [Eruca vesicaria subsp. sativa]
GPYYCSVGADNWKGGTLLILTTRNVCMPINTSADQWRSHAWSGVDLPWMIPIGIDWDRGEGVELIASIMD